MIETTLERIAVALESIAENTAGSTALLEQHTEILKQSVAKKTARKRATKKAEEPKAEEPKAEEPKAEEPKAEEPKAEDLERSILELNALATTKGVPKGTVFKARTKAAGGDENKKLKDLNIEELKTFEKLMGNIVYG